MNNKTAPVAIADEQILELVEIHKPGGLDNPYADPWLNHHYINLVRAALSCASPADIQPVTWTNQAAHTVLNMIGDGPYGGTDVADTIDLLNAAEIVRANIVDAAPVSPAMNNKEAEQPVKSWHERALEDGAGYANHSHYMMSEIESLRDVLTEIARTTNLTATESQFSRHLQWIAADAVGIARSIAALPQQEKEAALPAPMPVRSDYATNDDYGSAMTFWRNQRIAELERNAAPVAQQAPKPVSPDWKQAYNEWCGRPLPKAFDLNDIPAAMYAGFYGGFHAAPQEQPKPDVLKLIDRLHEMANQTPMKTNAKALINVYELDAIAANLRKAMSVQSKEADK